MGNTKVTYIFNGRLSDLGVQWPLQFLLNSIFQNYRGDSAGIILIELNTLLLVVSPQT